MGGGFIDWEVRVEVVVRGEGKIGGVGIFVYNNDVKTAKKERIHMV
jgi:hypothetical protein